MRACFRTFLAEFTWSLGAKPTSRFLLAQVFLVSTLSSEFWSTWLAF